VRARKNGHGVTGRARRHQIETDENKESGKRKNHGERSTSQSVVLGRKRSAALDDGATGGISAIILRAHNIAAARVRLQSLQIRIRICEPSDSSPKISFRNRANFGEHYHFGAYESVNESFEAEYARNYKTPNLQRLRADSDPQKETYAS
jgi:hypothetical protein